MDIHFSAKELKTSKLEVLPINFYYLLAIARQNPKLWRQFKQMIDVITEKSEED